MKKIRVSLLTKVVIAIAAGVLFGQFLPGGIARIFVTFNSVLVGSMCGNIADPLRNVKKPEKTVEP